MPQQICTYVCYRHYAFSVYLWRATCLPVCLPIYQCESVLLSTVIILHSLSPKWKSQESIAWPWYQVGMVIAQSSAAYKGAETNLGCVLPSLYLVDARPQGAKLLFIRIPRQCCQESRWEKVHNSVLDL